MNQSLIIQPILAMIFLTIGVWIFMYSRRMPYIIANKIDSASVNTPELLNARLPKELSYSSNNLKNLFEVPVIFYVLCLLMLITQKADTVFLYAAWAYVALRVVHSVIQCTSNIVERRFAVYLLSCLALWFMVGRFAIMAW